MSSSEPNFSPIRVRIRVLWQILRSVRNEEYEQGEKNEEIKTKFCSLVSRKWLLLLLLLFVYCTETSIWSI